jgi:hypothetical protein
MRGVRQTEAAAGRRLWRVRHHKCGSARASPHSDSAAIVDVVGEEVQHSEGHIVILIQEHGQLALADAHVALIEVIGPVPAQRPIALALLDDCMEEGQAKEQLAEGSRLVSAAQDLIIELVEGVPQVGLEALGGLIGHLDAALQDADREGGRGHAGEPPPEVPVQLVWLHGLADAFQLSHPGHCQVAVLQQHPASLLSGLINEAGGNDALALAQRDALHLAPHAHCLCKVEEGLGGVAATGQHKDEGSGAARVLRAGAQVKGRRLHKALPQVQDDKVLRTEEQLV